MRRSLVVVVRSVVLGFLGLVPLAPPVLVARWGEVWAASADHPTTTEHAGRTNGRATTEQNGTNNRKQERRRKEEERER